MGEAAAAQPTQRARSWRAAGAAGDEDGQREQLLEQEGAVERAVGLLDPGQLGQLAAGEVLAGSALSGVAGSAESLGTGRGLPVGLRAAAPHVAAHLVRERRRPRTRHGRGPGTAWRSGSAGRPASAIQVRAVGRRPARSAAQRAGPSRSKKRGHGLPDAAVAWPIAAGRGVVVDHDDQVLVAALVGDLVDADATHAGQPVWPTPFAARPDRPSPGSATATTVRHAIRAAVCATARLRTGCAPTTPPGRPSRGRARAPCRAYGTARDRHAVAPGHRRTRGAPSVHERPTPRGG